jgi:hypothetical protein
MSKELVPAPKLASQLGILTLLRTRRERPRSRAAEKRDESRLLNVVNGFLALVALSALVGVWFGRSGE